MTNLDSFKEWLKSRGVKDVNNFRPLVDIEDEFCLLKCWGFICPKDVAMPPSIEICKKRCPYYNFWLKEEEEENDDFGRTKSRS